MTSTIAVPRWPSAELAEAAAEQWGFNCGPASLCAVTGRTPDEIRPHMQDFEAKGYSNPTLMAAAPRSLGLTKREVYRSDSPGDLPVTERLALARVQWGGPWCNPGVPFAARYRQTHWVALLRDGENEYHAGEQWFLRAIDCETGETKDFALSGFHSLQPRFPIGVPAAHESGRRWPTLEDEGET